MAHRHRALARAAALHVPDSALSHVTAALMLALPNPRLAQGPVHLTVTSRPRVNQRSDWVHLHRAALPAAQLVTRDSLVLTGVERTVVDCCRKLHVTEAVAIADAALRSQMTMPKQLVEACHAQHRWPGVAAARRALESVDARRETWLESVSAVAMHLADVPFGVPQVEVLTWEGEFLGRVDFLWLETGVIGEADGYGKLLGTVEPSSDESLTAVARRVIALGERSARLTEAGFGVFHWSPVDLRNQGATLTLRYYAPREEPSRGGREPFCDARAATRIWPHASADQESAEPLCMPGAHQVGPEGVATAPPAYKVDTSGLR
jgi:hypothetical protein